MPLGSPGAAPPGVTAQAICSARRPFGSLALMSQGAVFKIAFAAAVSQLLHGVEERRLGGWPHSSTCPMPPRSAPAAIVPQSTSCPSGSARLLGTESQRR